MGSKRDSLWWPALTLPRMPAQNGESGGGCGEYRTAHACADPRHQESPSLAQLVGIPGPRSRKPTDSLRWIGRWGVAGSDRGCSAVIRGHRPFRLVHDQMGGPDRCGWPLQRCLGDAQTRHGAHQLQRCYEKAVRCSCSSRCWTPSTFSLTPFGVWLWCRPDPRGVSGWPLFTVPRMRVGSS